MGERHNDHWSSPDVNFRDLDLNLLLALDALLSEGSVTKAAAKMMRSQPALSGSLKRLRRQFDDELLVRVGNDIELSPLARQLAERLPLVMADVERVFATRSRFDATNSQRRFVVAAADYSVAVIGGHLLDVLGDEAPDTRVSFAQLGVPLTETVDRLQAYDGLILPMGFLVDVPHVDLFEDRWVILADSDNPAIDGPLTIDVLAELSWIGTFHQAGTPASVPPMRQLELRGVEPRIVATADGFAMIPHLVRNSERVAFIQQGLALRMGLDRRFALLECPFEAVVLRQALYWHPLTTNDPGHEWFRAALERAGAAYMAEQARWSSAES
jgi:DNA-binding transcriptional LysR family regulator